MRKLSVCLLAAAVGVVAAIGLGGCATDYYGECHEISPCGPGGGLGQNGHHDWAEHRSRGHQDWNPYSPAPARNDSWW